MDPDLPLTHDQVRRLRAFLFGLRCGLYAAGGAFLVAITALFAFIDYATAGRGLFAEDPAPEGVTGSIYIFLLPVVVGMAAAILPGRALGLPIVASMLLSPVAAGIAFATVWWPLLRAVDPPWMYADKDAFAWFFTAFVWLAVLVIASLLWPPVPQVMSALRIFLLAVSSLSFATLISAHEVLLAWWGLWMVLIPARANFEQHEEQREQHP